MQMVFPLAKLAFMRDCAGACAICTHKHGAEYDRLSRAESTSFIIQALDFHDF